MIKLLKPDFEFGDDRGFLCQLVCKGYTQVNVVYSKAGAQRGGHHHALNNEAFYVVEGSFEVVAGDAKKEERFLFKKGDMFMIPKGIRHDFNYLEDSILVGLYDIGVELSDGSKDIIKD